VESDALSTFSIADGAAALGLTVVGWYHSHPVFQPDPSLVDVLNTPSSGSGWRGRRGRGPKGLLAPQAHAGSTCGCVAPSFPVSSSSSSASPAPAAALRGYFSSDRSSPSLQEPFVAAIVSPYSAANPGPSSQWRWWHVVRASEGTGRKWSLGEGLGASSSSSAPVAPVPMELAVRHDRYLRVPAAAAAAIAGGAPAASSGACALPSSAAAEQRPSLSPVPFPFHSLHPFLDGPASRPPARIRSIPFAPLYARALETVVAAHPPEASLAIALCIDVLEYYRRWSDRIDLVAGAWRPGETHGAGETAEVPVAGGGGGCGGAGMGAAGSSSSSSAPPQPRVTNLDKLLASLEPHVALLPLEPGQRVSLVEDLRAFVEASWAREGGDLFPPAE
jgi:hypothetical protein